MQILKCPVCGKNPKFRLGGYGVGQYPYCDIYYKPFLRKSHLGVTHFIMPCGTVEEAKEKAIKMWNDKINEVKTIEKRNIPNANKRGHTGRP